MKQRENTAAQPALCRRRLRGRKRAAWLRTGVQTVFFFAMPGAFVAGFSGVKSLFQSVGAGQPLQWSGFVAALVALCAFTIVFGRFFCGYLCAFGSLGDFVYWLSGVVQKKVFRRRTQYRLPDRLTPLGQKVKYAVLALIVILCALNVYDSLGGWSPWSVFSFLTALRFSFSGYEIGVLLLLLIVAGMAVKERFFCQFLCPMGAVFSLLPILPFAMLRRDPENCLTGCQACKKQCPVSIRLEADGFQNGECISCERCATVCPRENLTRWDRRPGQNVALPVLFKAALFFALGAWLGLCRFL